MTNDDSEKGAIFNYVVDSKMFNLFIQLYRPQAVNILLLAALFNRNILFIFYLTVLEPVFVSRYFLHGPSICITIMASRK